MTFQGTQIWALRRWVLSLALLACCGLAWAGEDAGPKPEDLFPDTTLVGIAFPDLDAARKAAGSTRIGELIAQPEMREFLDPITAKMKAVYANCRAKMPMLPALEDIDQSVLSGEIAICVYSHGPGLKPGAFISIKPKDEKSFDNVVNAALLPFLQGQPITKGKPFSPFGEGDDAPGVLYSNGRFMICYPKGDLGAIADRIGDAAKRAKGTLAMNANFKEARAGMKDSAGWIYANPAALIEMGEELAAAKGGEESERVKAVLGALGINKINSILVAFTFSGAEPMMETYIGTADEGPPAGIFGLVGTKGGSKDLLQIVSPDAPYAAASSFNFAGIVPLLRKTLNMVEPNAIAQVDAVLAQASAMLKFDIQKDLLENIGSEFVTSQTPFDTAMPLSFSPGMVGVVRVKDAAKVEDCLRKLKAFADEQKLSQKVPSFYVKYDVVTYKGAHIYYISQLINGALAMSVVKDKLVVANSLNAAKRGVDQLSAATNILANKDFIAAMTRVSGKPFDPDNLPLSFAYSVDKGGGGGVLLVTGVTIAAETAALAGISEVALKNQDENAADPDDQLMGEFAELTKSPSGRSAVKILNGVDLNRWPDEEFFARHRQSHAAVGVKTAKGWFQRTEFPPPMPHYGSIGAIMPIALVAVGAASYFSLRAQNVAVMNAQRQAMIQAQAQAQAPVPLAAGGGGTNLQQLHLALTLYETEHNAFPTNPAELFPKYVNDLAVFKSASNPNQDAAYTLVTGVTSKDAEALLAFENPEGEKAKKGRNILRTDGTVEFVKEDEFQQLLKETEDTVKKAGRKFGTVPISVKEISKKKE